ncbi:hypothetical protein GCM10010376_93890 [Streptomyces violaceusniger]
MYLTVGGFDVHPDKQPLHALAEELYDRRGTATRIVNLLRSRRPDHAPLSAALRPAAAFRAGSWTASPTLDTIPPGGTSCGVFVHSFAVEASCMS